jgi:LmbE family N-acetylglucosaminyl deacetylase
MQNVIFDKKRDHEIKILCLGAHCDDIEIGCGGTILKLLQYFQFAEVYWIVFSSDSSRDKEAKFSANVFLKNAKNKSVVINRFRNGYFPYAGIEIKDYFEKIKNIFIPDIIFTHYCKDFHQDHRTISELTWNTFRNHLILEYEIPKYDGDFGAPNIFVPLEYSLCKYKVKKILASFKTQLDKHWFTEEIFLSALRLRGMECRSRTEYAEAFYCRKTVFNLKT